MTIPQRAGPPQPLRSWRLRRVEAVAIDAAALLVALVLTSTVAVAWLLARTEAGRLDVRDADARFAAALVLAVPPAWLAWLAPGVTAGATPGQRRAGLAVRGSAIARANRLAFHPLALPLWGWLAVTAVAAGAPEAGVAAGLAGAFTFLLGLGSLVLWAASPRSKALHDRLGRTRLVSVLPAEAAP